MEGAGKVERAVRQLRHASFIRRVSRMIGRTFDGDDARIGNDAAQGGWRPPLQISVIRGHGPVGLG